MQGPPWERGIIVVVGRLGMGGTEMGGIRCGLNAQGEMAGFGGIGLWCEKLIGWKPCGIYESDPNKDCQDTEFQQGISCIPASLSVEGLGCIQLNGSPKGHMEFTKQPMLMPRQKIAPHILTEGTYC